MFAPALFKTPLPSYSPKPRDASHSLQNILRIAVLIIAMLVILAPSLLRADTIYLKNGHQITAQVSHQDSKRVDYESSGGEFSIPLSMVDHIEKGALPVEDSERAPVPQRAISPGDLPFPATQTAPPAATAESQVVNGNTVDQPRLTQLDGDVLRYPSAQARHRLNQGYHAAATFLTKQGNPEAAIDLYRHALTLNVDDPGLTLALSYMLVKQTHFNDAVDLLIPAANKYPKIADIPLLLGSAYYSLDRLDGAIEEWKRALTLRDSPPLRAALAKAEKEKEASGSLEEMQSVHFLLRYDGNEAKGLGIKILDALEASFRDLQLDLDYYPRETIVVLVYSKDTFRDITRTPDWVGAMNDGKIRVPVSGLTSVTPDLTRLLKHELAHSFVHLITLDRCPVWFNEGLAQLEDGSSTAQFGSQFARVFAAGQTPTYPALESSFLKLPKDQVILAYAKSLAALEFIRETYGMIAIRDLLKGMPGTSNLNTLFEGELHINYASLEQEVAAYVVKKYGA